MEKKADKEVFNVVVQGNLKNIKEKRENLLGHYYTI